MASQKKQNKRTLAYMKSGHGSIDTKKFLAAIKAAGGKDKLENGIHTLSFNNMTINVTLGSTVKLDNLSLTAQKLINTLDIL